MFLIITKEYLHFTVISAESLVLQLYRVAWD